MKISWKSIQQFFCDVANRHDAAPRVGTVKQSVQAWNSLIICFAVSCPTYPENLMKIRPLLFSIMLLVNRDPDNRKIDPGSKGLNITSPKCSRLLLVLCWTFFWKFHENWFIWFSAMLLSDIYSTKNRKWIVLFKGSNGTSHRMFQVVSCTKFHPSWKFHENPFTRFTQSC